MGFRRVADKRRAVLLICAAAAFSAFSCARPPGTPDSADGGFIPEPSLKIGWAERDITPEGPVLISGQANARISEGVRDPVTATAMAVESSRPGSPPARVVMVSCDLSSINESLTLGVREHIQRELPELEPGSVFLSATHTHAGPYHASITRYAEAPEVVERPYGIELPAMDPVEYSAFASRLIADAVIEAWEGREPSGIALGFGHAVVGRNRLVSYRDGSSRMYGPTGAPDFSHFEGYEDHSVNILGSYLPDGTLTGLAINFSCPAQLDEVAWEISADYWHEARAELRARFGKNIFVLPQVGAAGDRAPHILIERGAESRMFRLAGRGHREEIAVRIADAVEKVLPLIQNEIDWDPVVNHRAELLELPRRGLSEEDVERALSRARPHVERYERMLAEIESNPEIRRGHRWYVDITREYRLGERGERVRRRFEAQQKNPYLPVEVHAVRLGDAGFVTNPFELYLDYGLRIRGRSPALQTFIVQLAGPGSYLPTERSIEGGAYGALPESTEIGIEGGDVLVEWSVDALNMLWAPEDTAVARVDFPVEIDGDISAWEGRPYIRIGSRDPERLWAKVYTGWDEDDFYLAVEVNDDAHFNTREGGNIWDGDSLQFAFGPREEAGAFNLGLALASGRARSHQWAGPDTGIFEKGEYAVLRDDETGRTFYEVRIPFECLMMEGETGKSLAFNAVVFNDNDGTGYVNWIEISRGLAGGWDPGMFGNFILENH